LCYEVISEYFGKSSRLYSGAINFVHFFLKHHVFEGIGLFGLVHVMMLSVTLCIVALRVGKIISVFFFERTILKLQKEPHIVTAINAMLLL